MLYVIIFIIAIIGAFVNGIEGFVIGGFLSWVGIEIIGFFVRSGGAVPKDVKDETATDFIAKYPDIINIAYPTNTPYEAKQKVSSLIEKMVERTLLNNPTSNTANGIIDPVIFFNSASMVAEEQTSKNEKELANELINFLRQHKQWYG
jgi:hypothetical protein